MTTLLFVGGSDETVPALDRAVTIGYDIIVSDQNPQSAGIVWAKERGYNTCIASTYSSKETIKAVNLLKQTRGLSIDGVLAVGCDVGPTVSDVAAFLGLPHIAGSLTRLSHNKRMLKTWLYPGDIPVPPSPELDNAYWVIKPIDSRGGRGCYRVHVGHTNGSPNAEIDRWMDRSRSFSPTNTIMLEKWVAGPQYSAETLVWNGSNVFTGYTHRNYNPAHYDRFYPHIIEDGGEGPAHEIAELADPLLERVRRHFGIESGTFKTDLVLDEAGTLYVIEIAIGRLSGGYSCTHHLPIDYGIDFLGAAFAIACGADPASYLEVGYERHTAGRYELPGDKITNATERGKFFFGVGLTREEAINNAERFRKENCA